MEEIKAMRDERRARVIARAEEDEEFRQRLIEDPRGAISEELDLELPEDLDLRVVEEGKHERVFVLPWKLEHGQVEDEELAGAVGGVWDTKGTSSCSTDSAWCCTGYHL